MTYSSACAVLFDSRTCIHRSNDYGSIVWSEWHGQAFTVHSRLGSVIDGSPTSITVCVRCTFCANVLADFQTDHKRLKLKSPRITLDDTPSEK